MLPSNMTLEQLQEVSHEFSSAKSKFKVTSPLDNKNFTAVVFLTSDQGMFLTVYVNCKAPDKMEF